MPDNPPIISGTRIGHVHLKVADLERALGFYCGVLGFEVMQRMGSGAAFISAGGYHHHIGLNTWGHPREPRSDAALGLVAASFARAGAEKSQSWRDPDGITVHLAGRS